MLYNQFKSILISTESSALLIGRQVTNHYFYPVPIDHASSSILLIHVFFKKIPRGDKQANLVPFRVPFRAWVERRRFENKFQLPKSEEIDLQRRSRKGVMFTHIPKLKCMLGVPVHISAPSIRVIFVVCICCRTSVILQMCHIWID